MLSHTGTRPGADLALINQLSPIMRLCHVYKMEVWTLLLTHALPLSILVSPSQSMGI